MAGFTRLQVIGPAGTNVCFFLFSFFFNVNLLQISVQHSEMIDPVSGLLEFLYSNAPMVDYYVLAGICSSFR